MFECSSKTVVQIKFIFRFDLIEMQNAEFESNAGSAGSYALRPVFRLNLHFTGRARTFGKQQLQCRLNRLIRFGVIFCSLKTAVVELVFELLLAFRHFLR